MTEKDQRLIDCILAALTHFVREDGYDTLEKKSPKSSENLTQGVTSPKSAIRSVESAGLNGLWPF